MQKNDDNKLPHVQITLNDDDDNFNFNDDNTPEYLFDDDNDAQLPHVQKDDDNLPHVQNTFNDDNVNFNDDDEIPAHEAHQCEDDMVTNDDDKPIDEND